MYRALLERALDPHQLDQLFHNTAQTQRTRELLFSAMVKLLFAVVSKVHPSVRSAYLDSLDELMTSLTAVYDKLQGIEPEVFRGFLLYAHDRLESILSRLDGGTLPQPLPGYRARILDGNHLAGTEHRPAPTRTSRGAARASAGRARPGDDAGLRRRPLRGRLRSGAVADRRGARTRCGGRLLDRRSELLLQPVRLRHGRAPRALLGAPAQGDPALGGDQRVDRLGADRHWRGLRADDPPDRHRRAGRRRAG